MVTINLALGEGRTVRASNRQGAMNVKYTIGLAVILAVTTLPSAAKEQSAGPLFDIVDVNRETVPAGTPEAFEAAFDYSTKYDSDERWYEYWQTVEGQGITFVPLTLIPLPDDRKALVSTGESDCTGHACSGVNAVHYLRRDETGRYAVDGTWLDVGANGTWGNPAQRWGWTGVITDNPVLYTEGGGVWQGYVCSFAALTELAADGPAEIARIPVHYSNSGAADAGVVTLTGTITTAEQGRAFTVRYAGSSQFDEIYVRGADGKYRLQGETEVPSC